MIYPPPTHMSQKQLYIYICIQHKTQPERKSTRKSVKYKLDEDGNKIPRAKSERSHKNDEDGDNKISRSKSERITSTSDKDGLRKSKSRRASKSKTTDREKRIALHAKAKREAERQRKNGECEGIPCFVYFHVPPPTPIIYLYTCL